MLLPIAELLWGFLVICLNGGFRNVRGNRGVCALVMCDCVVTHRNERMSLVLAGMSSTFFCRYPSENGETFFMLCVQKDLLFTYHPGTGSVMESFPPTLPGFNSLYNTLVIFVVVFFLVFQSLDHPLSEIHRLEHLCTKNTAIQIRYWKPQPIQHFIFGKTRNSFLFFILYFLEKQRVKRVRSPIRSRELEIESHSRSVSPSFIHLPVANTKIPSVVFRSNEQQFLTVSKSDNWSVPQPPRSRCDFVTRGVSGMVPGLRLLGAVFDYPGNLGFLHVESNAGKSSAWKRPAHSEMILL